MSRRDLLRLSGASLGGLAATGSALGGPGGPPGGPGRRPPQKPRLEVGNCYPTWFRTDQYSYFQQLKPITPWGKDYYGRLTGTKLKADEMRITFMGSVVPMPRRAQAEMSIFVEVGWDDAKQQPLDQFVFDLGCGASANYQACGVGFGRMNKVFITHLHGDHVTDLVHVYGFGDGGDRKTPLYVFGQGNSNVPNPGQAPPVPDPANPQPNNYASNPPKYQDGVVAFCSYLREALRWHTESQAFQGSADANHPDPATIQAKWGLPVLPVPVGDDPANDANAMIPVELDWTRTGLDAEGRPTGDNIAYDNTDTGARVLHYPVIHCRQGSMGYKLEWTPPGAGKPITMIYSSDTKPEWNSIHQAINRDEAGTPRGVDVFIHEMAVAPEIWAMKQMGLNQPGDPEDPYWNAVLNAMAAVQDSSHTPQGAFGYILSQINQVKPPRLAVATHFPTADDTVACALKSVHAHCPEIRKDGERLVWSFDLLVLRVFPDRIEQRRAVPDDFSFNPPIPASEAAQWNLYAPKYHDKTGAANPLFQIKPLDDAYGIPSTEDGGYHGEDTYRKDGY